MKIITADALCITPQIIVDESYRLIEQAARTCYKSEGAIGPGSDVAITKKMLNLNHGAMLEHATLSMRFICDRGVSHEVVRHRIASYAQESTRYCNYSKDKFGNEITYIDLLPGILIEGKLSEEQSIAVMREWLDACTDAERHYLRMLELGATPQIARSVLNNSTKTEIVVTMNLREWRHFLDLRTSPAAHPQMREIAVKVLCLFQKYLPLVVADLVQ